MSYKTAIPAFTISFFLGPYGNLDFLEIHKRLSKEFGPIVRITGLGREDRIFLYDADYIQTVIVTVELKI